MVSFQFREAQTRSDCGQRNKVVHDFRYSCATSEAVKKSRPEAALVVRWRLDKSILPRGGGFGNDYERNRGGGAVRTS